MLTVSACLCVRVREMGGGTASKVSENDRYFCYRTAKLEHVLHMISVFTSDAEMMEILLPLLVRQVFEHLFTAF